VLRMSPSPTVVPKPAFIWGPWKKRETGERVPARSILRRTLTLLLVITPPTCPSSSPASPSTVYLGAMGRYSNGVESRPARDRFDSYLANLWNVSEVSTKAIPCAAQRRNRSLVTVAV
jgi:hypothetical protein